MSSLIVLLRLRPGARARRAGWPLRAGFGCAVRAAPFGDASHRRDERVAGERCRRPFGDHLAVAHDDDAVGASRDLAEEMRDQDAGAAARNEAADEGEKLPGDMRVERGGRLVEDDERHRRIGDGEGAGDLDHLAAADREIADDVARRDAVARKDLVELVEDQPARALAPAQALQAGVEDAGILGDGQVGAERQLLEYAAHAVALGDGHVVVSRSGRSPCTLIAPRSGAQRPGQDMHERRLAGAVMADEADAFAGRDGEIDADKRTDGAETLFDAVQSNDRFNPPVIAA